MTALIESRGIRKDFGGLVAVNAVDLAVDEGHVHGLIGPNGSGKTTLLNLMSGCTRRTTGQLLWKGEDVSRRNSYEMARAGIGRTFQMGTLFDQMSCLDNVSMSLFASERWNPLGALIGAKRELARKAAIRDRAVGLLERMEISEVQDELAGSLPLGHRRWLGIAVALSTEPQLLMLDEPLSGMNAVEKEATMRRITSLPATGTTVLLVEHDMKAVMGSCDVISVLRAGVKIAEGSPEHVQNNRDVIDAYLGVDG